MIFNSSIRCTLRYFHSSISFNHVILAVNLFHDFYFISSIPRTFLNPIFRNLNSLSVSFYAVKVYKSFSIPQFGVPSVHLGIEYAILRAILHQILIRYLNILAAFLNLCAVNFVFELASNMQYYFDTNIEQLVIS